MNNLVTGVHVIVHVLRDRQEQPTWVHKKNGAEQMLYLMGKRKGEACLLPPFTPSENACYLQSHWLFCYITCSHSTTYFHYDLPRSSRSVILHLLHFQNNVSNGSPCIPLKTGSHWSVSKALNQKWIYCSLPLYKYAACIRFLKVF